MKWLFFAGSLFGLFIANNALFWMPGHYGWFNFVAAGVGILLAVLFAWLSGKRFIPAGGWKDILMTPPATICVAVLLVFTLIGLLRILTHTNR